MGYFLHAGTQCCTTCQASPCDPCAPCCLYPADVTDEGDFAYPSSDLPASVDVHYTYRDPSDPGADTDSTTTFYLTGDHVYTVSSGFIGGDGAISQINAYGQAQVTWGISREPGSFSLTEGPTSCLIGLAYNGSYSEFATFDVLDHFADTYTVNGATEIVRQNLCTWTGGAWTLLYNATTYQWELNGTAKTPPQNSPTGTFGSNTVA